MLIKKVISFSAALAMAAITAVSVSAADYGQAGISWMIKDEWEHRNGVGLEPFNENEDNVVTCQFKDVNITGNGDYTVEFSGWCVSEENQEFVEVGTLGLDTNIDFDANPDCVITITDCTIDGVTYTIDEQPELEDGNDGNHIMKIKNAYGVNATTTPEMDAKPWTTTEPITINFTVSGLAEDKIADNADEIIVTDYEEQVVEDTTDSADTDNAENTDNSAESAQSADSTSKSQVSDDDSDNGGVSAGIVGAAVGVAIVAIAAIVVIRKKK